MDDTTIYAPGPLLIKFLKNFNHFLQELQTGIINTAKIKLF